MSVTLLKKVHRKLQRFLIDVFFLVIAMSWCANVSGNENEVTWVTITPGLFNLKLYVLFSFNN